MGASSTLNFGKTVGCSVWLVKAAWNQKDSLNWWIAPSYAQSTNAYNIVKRLLPKDTFKEYKATLKLEVLDPDGTVRSTIEFKSGDNPDTLRGFAVHNFVIDEASRIPYDSFVSVMTTVLQTRGRGLIISTPKGRNWFYDVYQRGEKIDEYGYQKFSDTDPDPYPEWFSICMPTWSNPHVQVDSILELKNNLPEDMFRQEVAAKFLVDSAGVFKNIAACMSGEIESYEPGKRYVMGVDLARLKDYTVITVVDQSRNHVVYFERLNQTSWEIIYSRIRTVALRYKATVVLDTTGIGDPIIAALQSAGGIHFVPYKIGSSTAKQQLIDKLRVAFEQGTVSFPKCLYVLRKELESYEFRMTDAGRVQYSAPEGKHDDTVISLALANWVSGSAPMIYTFTNQRA